MRLGIRKYVPMQKMETLAKRVKARRDELNLSQGQVGDACGLKQGDISKIESGKILKTTEMVRLADALQCSPWWLAGLPEPSWVRSAPATVTGIDQASKVAAALSLVEGCANGVKETMRKHARQTLIDWASGSESSAMTAAVLADFPREHQSPSAANAKQA